MDLESVADELYGLRPDRFTAARNERVAEARRVGDQSLADRLRALRRPTLAAWASNLLVRRRPEETRSLVALGESLRQAHHGLDGDRLRELGHRRNVVVTALAREARLLAAEAGQPVGDDVQHEVEATLHAALADPEAAEEWAAGRLTRPLSPPVGFTAAALDQVARRPPRREPSSTGGRTPAREKAALVTTERDQDREQAEERRRRRAEHEEQQRARRERAREDAADAEREARAREKEHERAVSEQRKAEAELRAAELRAAALAEQVREAEERRHAAATDASEARERARETERAARRARRRAEEAAAEWEGLRRGPGATGGTG
ncbi:hypothetical protein [Streptomyces sp. NPDC006368]|uniref:hypothetical protein n=1 Tax=Streptomyces sp. NPDC006368 TaxID=3156760 RepID=UPI0033AC913A